MDAVKRRAPSTQRLMEALKIDRSAAQSIREIIHTERKAVDALEKIGLAEYFPTYGLEELMIDPFALPSEWRTNLIATYLNTGDTYSATLLARNESIFVGCWGDLAERYCKSKEN